MTTGWILVVGIVIAWLLVAILIGVWIGRAVRKAERDEHDARRQESTPEQHRDSAA
ncbi:MULTISPECIES: hypothetical protein [Nocardiaceae]|uniref:Type VI protein secretion system component VasK n=1 Tax=Rhodococcoides corynebacterioides TaxID=53972 RepID=A0ABS2KZ62_9NOCA|nr:MULTISPECIES: hypothetical protein [Rhodococcus]MBM7417213.1 type VI protein secretion system component VasK [Rhodococcus corynebacterioides]MBP1115466.1 type VI protein secretion system component VasK [Rhodococcus sp. PvP016]